MYIHIYRRGVLSPNPVLFLMKTEAKKHVTFDDLVYYEILSLTGNNFDCVWGN